MGNSVYRITNSYKNKRPEICFSSSCVASCIFSLPLQYLILEILLENNNNFCVMYQVQWKIPAAIQSIKKLKSIIILKQH